jgi:hypothetical protein
MGRLESTVSPPRPPLFSIASESLAYFAPLLPSSLPAAWGSEYSLDTNKARAMDIVSNSFWFVYMPFLISCSQS